jgi:hypothetical protein
MTTMYRRLVVAWVVAMTNACAAVATEPMTAPQFRKIVAAPGDDVPLSEPLRLIPFWRDSVVENVLTYSDGRTIRETCPTTAKTVGGKFIVFSIQSELYKRVMYGIVGYDEIKQSYRSWGLFGDVVTEAVVHVDAGRKTMHSEARYGDGFYEVSETTFGPELQVERAVVQQNGKQVMMRESRTRPAP